MSRPEALVGKQIDQFALEAFVARGAMGMVFKAYDSILARTVALKLIPKMSEDSAGEAENVRHEEARKRLIQETKAAGKLTQPNIVTIHAYGETEEFQYICMEYISGKSLAQILQERGKIPMEEAIPIKYDEPYGIVILKDSERKKRNWPEFSDKSINSTELDAICDEFEFTLRQIKAFRTTHDAYILSEAVDNCFNDLEAL